MMKRLCTLATATVFAVLLMAGTAHAQLDCQPGIALAFAAHPGYAQLYNALASQAVPLYTGLASVKDQATYAGYLAGVRAIVAGIPTGRLVLTLPDGTVVIDTSKPDDATNTLESGNSYKHFQDKTVNENHNSRVAILAAQEYPCGIGVERKLSTTDGVTESYVAMRLGFHLDSLGTARLSVKQ